MKPTVKEELHKIIDEADEVRLQEIYDWLHEDIPSSIQYTPAELNAFYGRLNEHEAGKSKSYTIEEAFGIIKKSKA